MLNVETFKVCFKCGETKPLSMFYKNPSMQDGHLNKCKECNKQDVRDNYRKNIDHYVEYDLKRYDTESRAISRDGRNARVKDLYNTDPAFRDKVMKVKNRWASKNQHKRAAHLAVYQAIKDGRLSKPTKCEKCGKSDCAIQGHHWSYLPEHHLDVLWVCLSCHGKEHRKLKIEQLHEPCLEPAQ